MKWSLSESIYVFYSWDQETVYIANPENKKFYNPVKKISGTVKSPDTIKNENLKVVFKDYHAYLDISGKLWKIGNLNTSNILTQLSQVTINSGESEGVVFGFSPVCPSEVVVIFPGTDLYNESEKEFIRKVNLSLYSKTTKYKEGHKYDSDKGTFWYLGDVISHKSDPRNSKRYTTSQNAVRTLHAFITDPQGYKNIKDIYTDFTVSYVDDLSDELDSGVIYLTSKNKSMVDLGQALTPLDCKIEDTWGDKLGKFIQGPKEQESIGSGRFHFRGVSRIIDALEITTDLTPQTEKYKGEIKTILEIEFDHILFKTYDTQSCKYGSNILASDSGETQKKALIKQFYEKSLNTTSNYYFYDYYTELFKVLFGIDVLELAGECISKYKLQTVSLMDYSDLIQNFGSLEYREPDKWDMNLDFVYCNEKKRSFTTFLPKGRYQDVIKTIFKEALDSNGGNIENFSLDNVGTDRNPQIQYLLKITLSDIANHYGVSDLNDLPGDLKDEILKEQIYQVTIRTRDNIEIKD